MKIRKNTVFQLLCKFKRQKNTLNYKFTLFKKALLYLSKTTTKNRGTVNTECVCVLASTERKLGDEQIEQGVKGVKMPENNFAGLLEVITEFDLDEGIGRSTGVGHQAKVRLLLLLLLLVLMILVMVGQIWI